MVASATVRVMSPEEIVSRRVGETPFLHWPEPATLFAEREMRLRQLASGHAMGDYLRFMADLVHEQQVQLGLVPAVPLPDAAAIERAALTGLPPLSAADWPRDPAWHGVLRELARALQASAPAGAMATLERLLQADEVYLERQADALLNRLSTGLDLAAAPVLAAALQVYWTHMLLGLRQRETVQGQLVGKIDDETVCPCCGSQPTASITRTAGGASGQRYLHCSLCSLQWHMGRIKCAHCLSTKSLAYQSVEAAGAPQATLDADTPSSRAATAKLQAETCDECGHYLKIVHTERDPFVDPAADDLASLTLDLLVSETGKQRHGVNFMLLFGQPDAPPPAPGAG
jgi:FdhE protein